MYCAFEVECYIVASLCRLCVSSDSGGRTGFYGCPGHASPQDALAVIPLEGGVEGDGCEGRA